MSEKTMFFVTGIVQKRRYMIDDAERYSFTHMVMAKDASEAKVMVYCLYERKCSPYDVSYSVVDVEVLEPIDFELTEDERKSYYYMLD